MENSFNDYIRPPEIDEAYKRLRQLTDELVAKGFKHSLLARAATDLSMWHAVSANEPYYSRFLKTMIILGEEGLQDLERLTAHVTPGTDAAQ